MATEQPSPYTLSPVLPVWLNGQLQILAWGSRDRRSRYPQAFFCFQEELESGSWSGSRPIPVEIPLSYGLARGVRFAGHSCIRGVVVGNVVYPIMPMGPLELLDVVGIDVALDVSRTLSLLAQQSKPSTHYYEVMTRQKRMPVFATGDVI
ncbi:3-hydroxyacyl-CoA dehydrogenase family protein [Planctomicrobium sp. SH664]|uniref:3-hydroxyacyl-CoA dehydrogenase family protein n=1 Tax=Planctomicrobium sp. SH664 TaxID=3448125 RepID=UPI003F5C9387